MRSKKSIVILGALCVFSFVLWGCGGGGGGGGTTNVAPKISSLTASKSVILSDGSDASALTVAAADSNGDTLTYTWSVSGTGTTLAKTSNTKYSLTTTSPGEFTVSVQVKDGRGGTATKTTVVTSFGLTADLGGMKGTITSPATLSGAQAAGSSSGNILYSPLSLSRAGVSEQKRAVRGGLKGSTVSSCIGGEFVPGELIVIMKSGTSISAFSAKKGLSVKNIGGQIKLVDLGLSGVKAQAAEDKTIEACKTMNEDPDVESADLNYIRHKMSSTKTPDDTFYYLQWNYPLMDLPEAWYLTTGSSNVYVAVLDTGIIQAHSDISGRLDLTDSYDFVSDTSSACDGDGRDDDPEDVSDLRCAHPISSSEYSDHHGTHVSGTIGASTNNGSGVAGVTWVGNIMMLRVLGYDGGTDDDILAALYYAAHLSNQTGLLPNHKAQIVNMSLGGDPGFDCPSNYQTAYTALHAAGVTVFVAAGNEHSNNGINPLANCNYVVAVGAVDRSKDRAWYSNAGEGLDVMAPGGDTSDSDSNGIYSTVANDSGTPSYTYMQGTSMATPHAAGVAALMLAANPDLTTDEVVSKLEETATDLGMSGYDTYYGYGLINAYAAVVSAQGETPIGDPVISVSPTSLSFSADETSKTAAITNTGSGTLTITSITTSPSGTWLGASYEVGADSITLTVTMDRTGLSSGSYAGTITIASNGGTKTINVTMTVEALDPGAPPACTHAGDDTTIYICVANTDDDCVGLTSVIVGGGNFSLFQIEEGTDSYYLIAGTDCDGDGNFFETGDFYGRYPASGYISVTGEAFTSNLNFPVAAVTASSIGSERLKRSFKISREK
jgi:serine protease